MKGFASNLISRHMHTEANIIPRLRGRFEPEQNSFHEDVGAAPVNTIDAFSEGVTPDENKGPEPATSTSTYRPVINTTRRDNGKPQPEPQPEPTQVNFNSAKTVPARPAVFEVTPRADSFKPANADPAENTTPNEPGIPARRQTAPPNQHNFNTKPLLNPVKSNDGGIVWPKPTTPENGRETMLFAGKKKGSAITESSRPNEGPSALQVNETVQPATGFKSTNSGMQSGVNAVSPPNINSNLRDGGQTQFSQAAQPVIKVTIGRIEVKAVHPQVPAPVQQRREPQKPALTLDDFLTQHKRNG